MGDPGFETRWGPEIFHSPKLFTPALLSYSVGTKVLTRGVKGPRLKLATYLHLVPRLRMAGAIFYSRYMFSSVWTGITLPFIFCQAMYIMITWLCVVFYYTIFSVHLRNHWNHCYLRSTACYSHELTSFTCQTFIRKQWLSTDQQCVHVTPWDNVDTSDLWFLWNKLTLIFMS